MRSVSRITTALANVSSVFQLFSFLLVCSDMISKGFGLLAFFSSVKASSVCIHLSCPVCIQSVVHGVRGRLFCGHKWCSLPEVSINSFLPLQFFVPVRLSKNARSVYIYSCELLCGSLFHYISKNQMLYGFNYDVIVLIIFKVCSKFQASSVSQIKSYLRLLGLSLLTPSIR